MKYWWFVFLLAASGCAARMGAVPAAAPDEERQVLELEDQLYRAEAELLGGLGFVPNRDCERLCRLGENICGLAARICEIADRHPDREDIRLRCRDGRIACDSARTRLTTACDCGWLEGNRQE